MTGDGLRVLVLQLVGNIFVATSALGAVTYLFRREFVRFAEFMALAVLVATFVYAPEVWIGVARTFATVIGGDSHVGVR